MPFVEDPAHLSKARLKSDLVAHNVALPPAASKKEVYVELHLRNIEQKNAAEFSSDDEEQTQEEAGRDEDPEVTQVPDPSKLTDECLKAALLKHGVKAGPIVASTRALYEKKLRKLLLLHSNGDGELNGAEKAELYSDSEEEQEEEEEPDEESVSEEEQQKPKETKKIQSENNKLPQEKVKNILKEALPETKTTTTRIYATPRRPIKGAAQRPIQYSLPRTLVSPMTLERREVERRLVSIHIQILFFVFVACIIFFIYVNVQDSTVLALLDSLSHCFDKEGGTLLLPETEDTQALYEQD
ncbi:Lamina-associated polypeptide 2, isoforms beta/gamma [Oryzias melastigma]|uniref:Lamina-associated polypeptide 2, isoforms beta/gamma n=1 Tax=Oryzias melastigma TaxID=30732 RepID=A0A834BWG9_ORYME|nr:Lamina-associated polypeptide 2, isoforms beta/gamma [Oryzias melastigma]